MIYISPQLEIVVTDGNMIYRGWNNDIVGEDDFNAQHFNAQFELECVEFTAFSIERWTCALVKPDELIWSKYKHGTIVFSRNCSLTVGYTGKELE